MTKLAIDYRGAILNKDYKELATLEDTFTCDVQDEVADRYISRPFTHKGVSANLKDIAKALTNLHYYNQPCMETAEHTDATIQRVHIVERY